MISNINNVLLYTIDGLIQVNLMDDQRTELGKEWCDKLECFDKKIPEEVLSEQYLREYAQDILDAVDRKDLPIATAVEIKLSVALRAYGQQCSPLRPPTDYELMAYVDGLQKGLTCDREFKEYDFTKGFNYPIRTEFFEGSETFTIDRPFYDEHTQQYVKKKHRIKRSVKDRAIIMKDDDGKEHYFLEKPSLFPKTKLSTGAVVHTDDELWLIFERPKVSTVKETLSDKYEEALDMLETYEFMSNFTYYEGQKDFIARMACRNNGILGAACGCGKSLMGISLIKIKEAANHILLMAPAATVTSGNGYTPAQWMNEFKTYAPDLNVYELFSFDHYEILKSRFNGKLPPGIYVSYPEAMFTSRAREYIPETWRQEAKLDPWAVERKFRKKHKLPPLIEEDLSQNDQYYRGVGQTDGSGSILCVAYPSLSTVITTEQGHFDMIVLDEAHTVAANLKSQRGRAFIRMEAKYRFCLSATPIPNNIGDLFGLLGWVCVDQWHLGNRRNAAFPYSVEQQSNFENQYLAYDQDMTATMRNSVKYGKKGKQRRVRKKSNIINQPTSLLKVLKPVLGYVEKDDCRKDMPSCDIHEVRVPLGKQQQVAYNLFQSMRSNVFAQYSQLRSVCADPMSYGSSPFNPKIMTILQLVKERLENHEQVVIVNARHGMTNVLEEMLNEAGITTSRLDGTMSTRMQSQESHDFKDQKTMVMQMGIKCAMGHSYPLCPNLICSSLEWSFGTKEQAFGRVYRVNSMKPVKIWCVLHGDTIEDVMFSRVSDKQESALLCLHGKRMTRTPKFSSPEDVLAEHLIDYAAGEAIDEAECEKEWPALRTSMNHLAKEWDPQL